MLSFSFLLLKRDAHLKEVQRAVHVECASTVMFHALPSARYCSGLLVMMLRIAEMAFAKSRVSTDCVIPI
jgi:hypothetical protein